MIKNAATPAIPGQTEGGSDEKRAAQKHCRILFLLPFAPDLTAADGGTRAMTELILAMASRHEVHVAWLQTGEAVPVARLPGGCLLHPVPVAVKQTGKLHRYLRLALLGTPTWALECRSEAMAGELAELLKRGFDIVHCEFHVMSQYMRFVRRLSPGALRIVTEHEPGICADTSSDGRGWRTRLGAMLRRSGWARFERRELALADAVVVFTEADAQAVRRLMGASGPLVQTIPLRISVPSPAVGMEEVRSDMLFFGNFAHPPNLDAARRLLTRIFPAVRDERPGTTLMIVGPNAPADLHALAARQSGEGVTITGEVPSVLPYLFGASVVVAPLAMGGGMRVKVLEACAAGRPLVASPLALAGLDLVPGIHCELAEDAAQTVQAVLRLLSDPERRCAMAERAQAWARATLDSNAWLDDYETLYRRVAAMRSSKERA